MADFSAPLSAGAPVNPIDYANQTIQNQDMSNARNVQSAGALNDLQAKQRSMQLSMLSGVLNEQDPEKQKQLLSNIVPIANKINPSYQIDPNIDIGTMRALIQGQVSPTEQATLANQRMMYGARAETIQKDPITGALIRVNKFTGEMTPVSAQEAAQGPSMMDSGIDSGIFPMPQQQAPQVQPQGAGGAPMAPPPPAFGFPVSTFANDPNSLKLARANAAKFDATRQQRDTAADTALADLDQLEENIKNVHGGTALSNARIKAEGLSEFMPGNTENRSAMDAEANAKAFANSSTALMQAANGGGSGRGTVIALKTTLASKPDPSQPLENNLSNIAKARGEINNVKLETQFLDAYKEANPLHVIDNNAYNLFDALKRQFPLTTLKNGKASFNEDNVQALIDAIPDALSNPTKYMGNRTAADQAKAAMEPVDPQKFDASGKPVVPTPGEDLPKQGTPIAKTQADYDALPSGTVYAEPDGKKYRKP